VRSFWYVDALALAGRQQEAEDMFTRLLGLCNDVGLLAEEYDPRQRRVPRRLPAGVPPSRTGQQRRGALPRARQVRPHEANRRAAD
jgi:GH15 family glucan-1,4-alpha-glucosidase